MENCQQITRAYLEWAPMSLAIREVSRIHALNLLDQTDSIFQAKRILDVGCGDGKWWTHILPNNLDKVHGLDISKKEISIASSVISAQCLDITSTDFVDKIKFKKFDLIIGNCSLEHVFHIDKALKNIYDVLEDGGTFILLVPTPFWALKGNSIKLLQSLSPRLSMGFSGFINGFFQHWHLYNHNIWRSILTNFKFNVKNIYGLGNSSSEFLFRLGLPTAFISFIVKCLSGKYLNYFTSVLIPKTIKNYFSQKIVKNLSTSLVSPQAEDIFEYIIVCKK